MAAPEWLGLELLDEDHGLAKWLAYLAAWLIPLVIIVGLGYLMVMVAVAVVEAVF